MRETTFLTILIGVTALTLIGALGCTRLEPPTVITSETPNGGKSVTSARGHEMKSQRLYDSKGRLESNVYWDGIGQIHNILYDVQSGNELSHSVTK